jgi:hypothetical protein
MSEPIISKVVKPLGAKAYGHIAHLPSSRLGPGDHKLHEGQAKILTEKARDRHDLILVQEKLDGSNVAVARVNGVLVPLIRAGYPAISSRFEQHKLFAAWVYENLSRFEWLADGQRVCGEWLAQAHGTRYTLAHDPFVAFDVITGTQRVNYETFVALVEGKLCMPKLLHSGSPISVAKAMELLGDFGHHGARDKAEGCVWRCERRGVVDFLGKYVRPDKQDGCYLPEICGQEHWNWRPSH